ncbi:hypothetical protein [Sanyastnella coralliicola]|uniref:hypothetical protein n=1 Tax=Sanyastnella coralliicola TaxID=3069118 RepID=UPI0027B89530|nr:hypothetical protein [Longitalea sp. SCSIO 12813]
MNTFQPNVSILILSSLMLCSCTKNNFDDEASFLVGRWKCVKAEAISYPESGDFDTIPITLETDLEILFLERGRLCLYDGNEKLKSARVREIFSTVENSIGIETGGLSDYLQEGNKEDESLGIQYLSDDRFTTNTLLIDGFVNDYPEVLYDLYFEKIE